MVEVSQNLPFLSEMAQHSIRIHASLDHFDSDAPAVLLVRALSQINCAHPTSADLTNDPIGAN